MRYSFITKVLLFVIIILSASCNQNIDEPMPSDPPIVEPEEPTIDPSRIFQWSDLECKTYCGNDIIMDMCEHDDYRPHTSSPEYDGRINRWRAYSRYSNHQYLSILAVSDSTITAQLISGWFNVQYLPGCSKIGSVAIPHIIPTQNDVTVNFKLDNKGHMKSNFCDTEGNNICGEMQINKYNRYAAGPFGINRYFYLNGNEYAYRKLKFLSVHIQKAAEAELLRSSQLNRNYHSFHGFGDIADTNSFITANWHSNLFDELSQGLWSTSEFFSYVTNLNFLDTEAYFSCAIISKSESMDRIMAMRFDNTQFIYNTKCLEMTGRYENNNAVNSIKYDRLAINFIPTGNDSECLFFINPEILINGTTQIKDYYEIDNIEKNLSDTSIDTERVTYPMHTPKSYDWNAEMFLALSPYTANGLSMASQLTTNDYGDKKRDYLTFSFTNTELTKRFVKAYFSVLEDNNNLKNLKKCIDTDTNLGSDKKRALAKILDNINSILENGRDFELSFQLFGDLRKADNWDYPDFDEY